MRKIGIRVMEIRVRVYIGGHWRKQGGHVESMHAHTFFFNYFDFFIIIEIIYIYIYI